jgi:hypothetical protein
MMTNIEKGTWDYMRNTGLWHFDPQLDEPKTAHRVIAQIRGPLDKLIDQVPPGQPKTLQRSMQHRPDRSTYFDRIQKGNEADAARLGLDPERPYAEVFDAKKALEPNSPMIEQLVAKLPLDNAYWKLHRQKPGQNWPMHFDNYHAFERKAGDVEGWVDPGIRRLWIMLSDWRWGQFVQLGNKVWSHWSAGDVMYFDWLVPHGSANCGHSDRVSLFVTGEATHELENWVSAPSPRTIELR